uniref:Uncharacterized protein n=1 Tax=Peronospora matthiolae TaxID=2874970 RepID=A0AAV1UUF4_9STRA
MKDFYLRALFAASVLSTISDRAYGGIEPDPVAYGARTLEREAVYRQLRARDDVNTLREERFKVEKIELELKAALEAAHNLYFPPPAAVEATTRLGLVDSVIMPDRPTMLLPGMSHDAAVASLENIPIVDAIRELSRAYKYPQTEKLAAKIYEKVQDRAIRQAEAWGI